MNTFLRTLEDWTSYQDYAWFITTLAWSAVVAGTWPWSRERWRPGEGWLFALSISVVLGAGLEIALLVQHLDTPYEKFDAAMGLAQAIGVGAVWWPSVNRAQRYTAIAAALGGLLIALAAGRLIWPMEVKGPPLAPLLCTGALVLVGAFGVLRLLRREAGLTTPGLRTGLCLWVLSGAIATHGPLAIVAGIPRRSTDLSHLALPAALLLAAGGVSLAFAAWRQRFAELPLVKRSLWLLAAWLVAGLGFAVWSGRDARLSFEENLLRRASTGAALLDVTAVRNALGPSLRITSVKQKRYPTGEPVTVANVTNGLSDEIHVLRSVLHRLHVANPDVLYTFLLTPRDGWMLVAATSTEHPKDPTLATILRPVEEADFERLARNESFLVGPFRSSTFGAKFAAYAPVGADENGKHPMGWLVFQLDAVAWTKSFLRARLQAMVLVAAGVWLWGLGLAYRLRRERMADAEKRAVAAAAADRVKSAFLAKVSHELRTPLQSLLGYSELLERTPLAPEPRAWVNAVRTHGEIMLRLVSDLIDLGTLQAGAFRLRVGRVHLSQLATECIEALRPRAEAKGLGLSLACEPRAPVWVEGDAVRLRQILLNLMSNAVKYTEHGSVHLTLSRHSPFGVRFAVRDTGPGIPLERRAELFRPFTRLTQDETAEGSGVGLALVSGLCVAMSGSVRLEDREGGGSVFIVELPLEELPDPVTESAQDETRSVLTGLRVVVADDNTLVRELLTISLRDYGADVVAVTDGEEAVRACTRHSPHAVVLDLSMPHLDGFGAARAIRAAATENRPLIIGLSAHAQQGDETAALAAGMDHFLVKPVRLTSLATMLQAGLHGPVESKPPLEDARPALIASLRAHYERETPQVLSAMHAAFGAGNWQELRRRAHYLKNSADVIGAVALAADCRELFSWAASPEDTARGASLLARIQAASPCPFPPKAAGL